MTTNNDQILINQIIEGDTNAFSVLVDRYKDLVFTLALRMLKNREEAEEVAQDTFIKTYKSLVKFKGDSKFSTWIYKVAYNTCLDRIKKNKKYLNDVEINEFTEHQVKTIDNALDKIDIEEEIIRLDSHVSELNKVLKKKGSKGLRIDFYMQEINREANTISSKSKDPKLSEYAIEIKTYLNQIREIAANIA